MEEAWAHRNGSVHLLALDWGKAFDSINVDGLLLALRRFGLPAFFLEIIQSIYSERQFRVNDCSISSEKRAQQSGICQGCPLSPFFFTIVMTVLMRDAYSFPGPAAQRAVDAVERAGSEYCLSLHWGKVQAMPVCSDKLPMLMKENGDPVAPCDVMIYLGGLVSSDGRVNSELSRRIGMAFAEFRKLKQVWGHANLGQRQKMDFFQSSAMSKLRLCMCMGMVACVHVWVVVCE